MKKTFVYALYTKNKFPDCCCEPSRYLNSLWTDKKTLDVFLKKNRKDYPMLYGPDEIEIEKIELNEAYAAV